VDGGRAAIRTRVTVLACAALACATPACAASKPTRATARTQPAMASKDAFGVNGGALWTDGARPFDTVAQSAAIARAGLGMVRAVAYWNLVEPNAPDAKTGAHHFVWDATDKIASDLASHGIRWYAILGFSSPWGGSAPGSTVGQPRFGPFSEYAAAFAQRYGRDGSFWHERTDLPYVPVLDYEVWNEPNVLQAWTASRYADFYLTVRNAVRGVQPAAKVVVGALSNSSATDASRASEYLKQMFAARPDLSGNIDAVGMTIYEDQPEQVIARIAEARLALDALGQRTTPLDVNETGWATQGSVPLTDIKPVSESGRADRLKRVVELVASSDCGVESLMPYAWATFEDDTLDANAWFGLADRHTGAPKPSGQAYADAVAQALADPGARPTLAACGRPDLPPLVRAPDKARRPFALTLVRSCRARKLRISVTLGNEPEPYGSFRVKAPGAKLRTLADPDGEGPRDAQTVLTMRTPLETGRVSATAYDALKRLRRRASARYERCPTRARPRAS
jgi:hypothetical protein